MMRIPPGAEGAVAAGWATTTVWPATVTEAERASGDPLASTASITVPLPLPVSPSVIRRWLAELDDPQRTGRPLEKEMKLVTKDEAIVIG